MLTPLDAEFLDGMISVSDQVTNAAEQYLAMADATSDPQTMDMARSVLEMSQSQCNMFKQARGHVDGDSLRRSDAENNVEVAASY